MRQPPEGDPSSGSSLSPIKYKKLMESLCDGHAELVASGASDSAEDSLESPATGSDVYFDSISNHSQDKLMHVEVEFEWNPLLPKDLACFPSASDAWTPLSGDKGGISPHLHWISQQQGPTYPLVLPEGLSPGRELKEQGSFPVDSLDLDEPLPAEMPKTRGRLRNRAWRLKRNVRPCVVPPDERSSCSARKEEDDKGPSFRDPSLSGGTPLGYSNDVNTRVHQILARIAASAR